MIADPFETVPTDANIEKLENIALRFSLNDPGEMGRIGVAEIVWLMDELRKSWVAQIELQQVVDGLLLDMP